jgi:hypothetical protein
MMRVALVMTKFTCESKILLMASDWLNLKSPLLDEANETA